MMRVDELAERIPDSSVIGDGSVVWTSVSTDTRTLEPGALYFALRGERFDGHEFVANAMAAGAAAIVTDHPAQVAVPALCVNDTRLALGTAAAVWRERFHLPLIAVTGSNGKTTVTQMVAAILEAAFGDEGRLATRGNLNNDIGVPLMLFRLNEKQQAAVLELGMNHPGEIRYLARIARPTVALVNNAQREHQEFMDGVEATAHENGEAIEALPAEGVAVFPADDACAPIWRKLAGSRRVIDFALTGSAAVTAHVRAVDGGTDLAVSTPVGDFELALPLSGAHNLHNALAAVAAALAIGVELSAIRAGLESFKPVSGRGVEHRTPAGVTIIDDTYNANPDSVRAAIDLLVQRPSPRVLILGDMGEVGADGPEFHREVGAYARTRGVDTLLGLGDLCSEAVAAFNAGRPETGRHFESVEALIEAARAASASEATLLAKGSRFMRMERVIKALLNPG